MTAFIVLHILLSVILANGRDANLMWRPKIWELFLLRYSQISTTNPNLLFLLLFSRQRNVSSEDAKAPPFIRALVTVVCEGAMERGDFIDKLLPFLYILFRYSSIFFTSHFTGPFLLTRAPYSLIVHFVLCGLVFSWEITFFIITQILLLPSSCCITRLLVTQWLTLLSTNQFRNK